MSLKHSCAKLHSPYNDLGREIPATDYRQGKMHGVKGCFAALRTDGYGGLTGISQLSSISFCPWKLKRYHVKTQEFRVVNRFLLVRNLLDFYDFGDNFNDNLK